MSHPVLENWINEFSNILRNSKLDAFKEWFASRKISIDFSYIISFSARRIFHSSQQIGLMKQFNLQFDWLKWAIFQMFYKIPNLILNCLPGIVAKINTSWSLLIEHFLHWISLCYFYNMLSYSQPLSHRKKPMASFLKNSYSVLTD
jgi:hypothetical protein